MEILPIQPLTSPLELKTTPEIEALGRLIAALGRSDFEEVFLAHCADLCHADQIVMFAVENGAPRCLIAHRDDRKDYVPGLLRQYAREYMGRDRFLEAAMAAPGGYCAGVINSSDITDEGYRKRLFLDAGLAGKLAAVSVRDNVALYLNFYYADLRSNRFHTGVERFCNTGRLLLEIFRKHYLLRGSVWASPSGKVQAERYVANHLPQLSAREVQVCARILCGYSTDAIGDDLAVSRTTVKTFRRRAYAKLGIGAQNELFARCAGLAH